MKKKINLKNLILMLIGVLFCVIPLEAKAYEYPDSQYEVELKFYKFDVDYLGYMSDWQIDFTGGTINPEEITDINTLKKDDYVLIAPNIKALSSSSKASSFSLYFSYDENMLAATGTWDKFEQNMAIAYRSERRGGSIFPTAAWSILKGSIIDGAISLNFGDTGGSELVNTTGGPAIFILMKVLKDVNEDNPLSFVWYTEENKLITTDPSSGEKAIYVSMASDYENNPINVNTMDIVPEVKLSTDTTLKTLTLMNGTTNYTLTPEFVAGSSTTSYTLNVPFSVTNLDLQAVPTAEGKAKIAPGELGTKTLNLGTNSLEFTVIPEDPNASAEVYTITVTRQNNVATLKTLTADGTTVTGFVADSATPKEFNITTSNATISLAASVTDGSNATISAGALGSKPLTIGSNNHFTITVTSEDGTVTTDYKINVTRKSNVATLSALSVTSTPQGTMGTFASGTKTYTYTYDETVGNVTINATTTHNEASVAIGSESASKHTATSSSVDPKTTSSVVITVTAEDGTTTDTYTINFAKKKSTVNTLKSLSVTDSGGTEYITSFVPGTKTYNITVPHDVSSLNVSAETTSDYATINSTGSKTYTGTINNIGFSSNTETITVNPEDSGAARGTYTINITRTKSNNANLTNLTVNSNSLDGFDGTVNKSYTLDPVGSNVNSVPIAYTKENEYAEVTITNNGTNVTGNNVTLSEGNNVIVVTSKSQDKTKTITQTINIYKKSKVATLSALSVTSTPQGTMGTFASGTKTYTYTYDETVGNVTINAITTHNEASVAIGSESASKHTATSTSIDPKTTSSVVITVTAEDGTTTDTYTINFTKKKSTVNTLKSLSVTDSGGTEYITSFASGTKTYNITVPHDVSSLNVSAETTSSAATINGGSNIYNGSITNILFTTKTATLTVAPEEGSATTYTINVTRRESSNANLTNITVDGNSIVDFDGTTDKSYTLSAVANATASVTIAYTKENEYAEVTITNNGTNVTGNNVNLSEGNNVIVVTSTSQDGSSTVIQTINIKRKSNNADLATLVVTSNPQGSLSPNFKADETTYTYNYDRTVSTINVAATSNHGASITGTGDYNIPAQTSAELTVTPEDGTIKIYTVNFVQNLENDSSLSSLTVKNGSNIYTLTPAFSSDRKDYSLTVLTEVDTLDISATAAGTYAKSVVITKVGTTTHDNGNSTISLDPGSNKVEIVVTAEDNTTSKYSLDITRTINTNASLTNLTVNNVTVPEFNSSKTNYTLDAVGYDVDNVTIGATPVTGATVSGTGNVSLTPGENTFEVEVTAQDGTTKNKYTIKIRRKLNDAKITNLAVANGLTIRKDSTDEFKYTIDVPHGTTTISLTPTFMTGASLKTPSSLDNIDITSIEEIVFVVKAEDETYTETYTVSLNKLANNNAYLSSLSVSPGSLNETFNREKVDYTVTVGSDDDSITVTATAEDSNANITGNTTYPLDYGTKTITVTVTAENGTTTKDYTIDVTRPKSNDTSLNDLTINGTQISGFTSTKDNYEITLPYGTTSFELNAIPNDSKASIPASELGTKTITGNTETYTFTVTAHDNTTKTYTVKVTVAANNDTSIDSLTVLGLTPTWNDTESRYELTVDGEILKVGPSDINATFGNGASITAKDPEQTLVSGENTYKFTVTAADGTPKEYTVVITRNVSTVNTLDTLTSTVGTITPEFKPEENNYTLTLPKGTNNFTINATATSKNPATRIAGTGDYSMPLTNNPISVIVTSEDGNLNTYEITVKYEESNDATLGSLSVEDYELDKTFASNEFNYSIGDVLDTTSVLTVNAVSANNATIKYQLNSDAESENNVITLPNTLGENTIKVIVTSEDKSDTKTYNIKFTIIASGLDKIVSSVHTINDNYILTVKPETKFNDEFKNKFDNEPSELILYLKDGTTKVTNENIGTGMILKLERNGQVLDSKVIVILGDVNGDGTITINDAVLVVNHFLEPSESNLRDAYLVAADTNKDSTITINDAVLVVNHFLEPSESNLYKGAV